MSVVVGGHGRLETLRRDDVVLPGNTAHTSTPRTEHRHRLNGPVESHQPFLLGCKLIQDSDVRLVSVLSSPTHTVRSPIVSIDLSQKDLSQRGR